MKDIKKSITFVNHLHWKNFSSSFFGVLKKEEIHPNEKKTKTFLYLNGKRISVMAMASFRKLALAFFSTAIKRKRKGQRNIVFSIIRASI